MKKAGVLVTFEMWETAKDRTSHIKELAGRLTLTDMLRYAYLQGILDADDAAAMTGERNLSPVVKIIL